MGAAWAGRGPRCIPQGVCENLGSFKVTRPVISLPLHQEADPPPERDPVPQRPLCRQSLGYDPVHQ